MSFQRNLKNTRFAKMLKQNCESNVKKVQNTKIQSVQVVSNPRCGGEFCAKNF